jgi:hypothetical protein
MFARYINSFYVSILLESGHSRSSNQCGTAQNAHTHDSTPSSASSDEPFHNQLGNLSRRWTWGKLASPRPLQAGSPVREIMERPVEERILRASCSSTRLQVMGKPQTSPIRPSALTPLTPYSPYTSYIASRAQRATKKRLPRDRTIRQEPTPGIFTSLEFQAWQASQQLGFQRVTPNYFHSYLIPCPGKIIKQKICV